MSIYAAKKQKNIVVIGGGTGTSTILEGLKKYPVRLTAIVNMFDSGGSSGWLRKQLGVLPPGDLRQCLAALSDSKIWQKLLEFRFQKGILKGQNFGNLLISVAALTRECDSRVRFENGFKELAGILSLKGMVIPVSLDNSHLVAELKNGKVLRGENKITDSSLVSKLGVKKLYLEPQAKANPKALSEISQANIIIIAPGILYSSVLPNFLAEGIAEAIQKSRAKKIYICNLMTKRGHTDKWSVENHLAEIGKYLGKSVVGTVLYNNDWSDKNILTLAEQEGIEPVILKKEELNPVRSFLEISNRTNFYGASLIAKKIYEQKPGDPLKNQRSLIRHDTRKLAKIIMKMTDF